MNTMKNETIQTVGTLHLPDYTGQEYIPVPPQADNDALRKHDRIVLYNSRFGGRFHTAKLYAAPAGDLVTGWIIGVLP